MRPALTTITEILESTGMKPVDVDHLLARFLQEEAFAYVEYMSGELRRTFSFSEDIRSVPDLDLH